MKKLLAFAMILSLGVFCTIGCKPAEKPKKPEVPATGPATTDAPKTDAPAAEAPAAEAPKTEEAAPPAEEKPADK